MPQAVVAIGAAGDDAQAGGPGLVPGQQFLLRGQALHVRLPLADGALASRRSSAGPCRCPGRATARRHRRQAAPPGAHRCRRRGHHAHRGWPRWQRAPICRAPAQACSLPRSGRRAFRASRCALAWSSSARSRAYSAPASLLSGRDRGDDVAGAHRGTADTPRGYPQAGDNVLGGCYAVCECGELTPAGDAIFLSSIERPAFLLVVLRGAGWSCETSLVRVRPAGDVELKALAVAGEGLSSS